MTPEQYLEKPQIWRDLRNLICDWQVSEDGEPYDDIGNCMPNAQCANGLVDAIFEFFDNPPKDKYAKTGTELALEAGNLAFERSGGASPELLRVIRLALENEEKCKNIYNKN